MSAIFTRPSTRFARSGMVRLGRLTAPAHHDTLGAPAHHDTIVLTMTTL